MLDASVSMMNAQQGGFVGKFTKIGRLTSGLRVCDKTMFSKAS